MVLAPVVTPKGGRLNASSVNAPSLNAATVLPDSDAALVAIEAGLHKELRRLSPHSIDLCPAVGALETVVAFVSNGRLDVTQERSVFTITSGTRIEVFNQEKSRSLFTSLSEAFWKIRTGSISISMNEAGQLLKGGPEIGGTTVARDVVAFGKIDSGTYVALLSSPRWKQWGVQTLSSGFVEMYVGPIDKLTLQKFVYSAHSYPAKISVEYWCKAAGLRYCQEVGPNRSTTEASLFLAA